MLKSHVNSFSYIIIDILWLQSGLFDKQRKLTYKITNSFNLCELPKHKFTTTRQWK